MNQEYFVVELSASISLALALEHMTTITQFEQKDVCLVPGVAPFWYGVANFKGSLLWVLDSDRFFNLDNSLSLKSDLPNRKLTSVLLTHQIEGTQRSIALVVNQLKGLLKVQSSQIQPLSPAAPSSLQTVCEAKVETENGITYILDLEVFFQHLERQSKLVSAQVSLTPP